MVSSCTDNAPSYIYWNSSGSTSPVTIKNNQTSPSTEWIGYGNAFEYTAVLALTDQSNALKMTLNQVPGNSYAGYVRYGDPVTIKNGNDRISVPDEMPVAWVSPSTGNCGGAASPIDYSFFQSNTKSNGDPVLYGDTLALQSDALCDSGFLGSPGSPSQQYPTTSPPGLVPYRSQSPLYMYEIQDNNFSTKTQTQFVCYGTDCICALTPTGAVSYSSCQSSCGHKGSVLPDNSNTYKPFPGVASLPLAGCAGGTSAHTYTLYSGDIDDLSLLFILGNTTTSVTSGVPGKVKAPKYSQSNGFLLFSYTGSDGSATVGAPGTNGPLVSWPANSQWQSWGTGGTPKNIDVGISMNGLSFTLNGSTQTVSFIDIGYASGLYCNLYAAQGEADNDPYLAVAGSTSDAVRDRPSPEKPLAPDWWWYGLVITGVVAIAMILLVAFCCHQ